MGVRAVVDRAPGLRRLGSRSPDGWGRGLRRSARRQRNRAGHGGGDRVVADEPGSRSPSTGSLLGLRRAREPTRARCRSRPGSSTWWRAGTRLSCPGRRSPASSAPAASSSPSRSGPRSNSELTDYFMGERPVSDVASSRSCSRGCRVGRPGRGRPADPDAAGRILRRRCRRLLPAFGAVDRPGVHPRALSQPARSPPSPDRGRQTIRQPRSAFPHRGTSPGMRNTQRRDGDLSDAVRRP